MKGSIKTQLTVDQRPSKFKNSIYVCVPFLNHCKNIEVKYT